MFVYETVNAKNSGTSGKWPRKNYTWIKMETVWYKVFDVLPKISEAFLLSHTLCAKEIGPGHYPGDADSFLTVIELPLR